MCNVKNVEIATNMDMVSFICLQQENRSEKPAKKNVTLKIIR